MNEGSLLDFVGKTAVIVSLFAILPAIAFISNRYSLARQGQVGNAKHSV